MPVIFQALISWKGLKLGRKLLLHIIRKSCIICAYNIVSCWAQFGNIADATRLACENKHLQQLKVCGRYKNRSLTVRSYTNNDPDLFDKTDKMIAKIGMHVCFS